MDDIDKAFLESLVPDGCVSDGFLAVVSWIDEAGESHWRCYNQLDRSVANVLGLIELAKLSVIAACDTGLPIRYPDEED